MVGDAPRVGRVVAGRYRVDAACELSAAPSSFRATRVVDGAEVLLLVAPASVVAKGGVQRFIEAGRPVRGVAEGRWMMVLDEGVDADGSPFLVTSYWPRETLEQRVARQGGVSPIVGLDIALDVLSALAVLHDRSMVHGGLTTEDVLLVMGEDGALHGHVLAGGMLRALACGARADDAPLRAVCMAPEQRRGDAATPESDVWAAGVILARTLTGALPFEGLTATQIEVNAATQAPAPFTSQVPEPVARVIERALSKRAEGRFHDARAMRDALLSALVDAGLREPPRSVKPSARPLEPAADDDDAGDLDALIASAQLPSQRPSAPPPSAPPPSARPERPSLQVGPPRSVAPPRPSAPAAPSTESFDLDAEAGASVRPIEIPKSAALPNIPVAASVPAPALGGREQPPLESFTVRPSRELPRRAPERRASSIGAGPALLVVLLVTGTAGYLSRDFIRRMVAPPPTTLRDLELPAETHPRADAEAAAPQDASASADDSAVEDPSAPFSPRVETQAPAEFGEQLRVALPPGLSPLQRHQFVTHVSAAAQPLSATVGGFVSCTDGHVYAHPGGVSATMSVGAAAVRCEGVDVALSEDLDGDGRGDLVAVDARRAALLVVGSRRMRVERTLPLPNAWGVVAGLSFETGRRREPGAVVYVTGEGVIPGLAAVGLRSGRVYWRSDPSLHVGSPSDYGLAVSADLDRDGANDVIVGLVSEGRACVTALSGATGLAVWGAPRCAQEAGAQYLSSGVDLNDDRRADLALGRALGQRLTVLSGLDGAELSAAPATTEAPVRGIGPNFIMTPDLARDGFPDLVAPLSEANGTVVAVYSANDGHRMAAIPLVYDGTPVPIPQLRIQYVENFVFQGSRSLLIAMPGAVLVYGAAPRS